MRDPRINCEDDRWMKLAQDLVQCRALELAVLTLCLLVTWNPLVLLSYQAFLQGFSRFSSSNE
jgi:hypothetical protein